MHSWHLRCIPRTEQFQHVTDSRLRMEVQTPEGISAPVAIASGLDGFGNLVQFGCIEQPHTGLSIVSEGKVSQMPYRICGTAHGMFASGTPLTMADSSIERFVRHVLKESCAEKKAEELAQTLHNAMTYAPGTTNVKTTAAQAFSAKKGVCQDYAHILIAMLRSAGIPARYACGFLTGEGATHAWVEYFHKGVWLALDPTNGHIPDGGLIKVAHGRDSADCAVTRGVFTGRTSQHDTLSIKVERL